MVVAGGGCDVPGETKISDLMRDIKRGELILPEFQRGYVWDRHQVRSYLHSLYRGYPTGTFLVWKTPTPPAIRGGKPNDESKSYRLILDGQQRLTSVYVLIEGEAPPFYEGERLYFNLYFNVLKEEFAYYKATQMKGNPEWIPVTEFFQRGGLASFLQEISARDPDTRDFYFANISKLTALDRIKDYFYYQNELTELDMERVVEVFNLVNSSGTRLSKSDLALAHICAKWPEAREQFRAAQERYAKANFTFDLSFFTRCCSIVATGSALYEPLYRIAIEEVQEAWPKVVLAIDYLLNVLRGVAFIDAASTFPSTTAIIPLVSYLALTGRTHFDSPAQKKSFLHWMYAAMMWGRYSGSSETKLQADIEVLKSEDPPSQLREKLIADRGRIKVEARDLDGAGVTSPFYPMTYIVARGRGAVAWFHGTALYQKAVGRSFGLENHHIFPQALLYKSGYDSSNRAHKQLVHELANLAYLTQAANLSVSDRAPGKYLHGILDNQPNALRQQSVPEVSALWEVTQFEAFLAERRRQLADAINTFMDALLRPELRAGLSIADFIARGEGPNLEFKSSLRWDRRQNAVNKALEKVVIRTLAGFMNSNGGTLVVGVADDGHVVGLRPDIESLTQKPSLDGLALHIQNLLIRYLGQPAASFIEVSFATADTETVAVLSAERSPKPVFLEEQDRPEFWVRSGPSTRLLDVKEASDYIAAKWKPA